MTRRSNRRDFLKAGAALTAGLWVAGGVQAADSKSPNEKINFGCIGVGGKGSSDTDNVGDLGNVVALCDIDDEKLNAKAKKFEKARKFNDFRKMLEEVKDIDAVTVSTPDHTHAVAAMMAMKMGKHVYCQKPLTHSVHEARALRETAKKMKVATQMGNQGTALDGLRQAIEVLRGGAVGPIKEVHVWTNRPIWPQGPDALLKVKGMQELALAALRGETVKLPERPSAPKHVHWDLFLGPAPERAYDPIYHPFSWRGWWDFGTGALGDMGCHTANMAFMALKLGYPKTVKAEVGGLNPETCPVWATVTWEFPAREGMPPCKVFWYEGMKSFRKNLPDRKLFHGENPPDSGSLMVGEKGTVYSPDDYGARFVLLPKKDFEGFKAPEAKMPLHKNDRQNDLHQKKDWVEAIKGGPPAPANFEYAGLLTEMLLLGNVAIRTGKKLEWDGEKMQCTNCPEAERLIKPEYRQGWSL
jgi:predicted dehydrogenase